MKYDLVCFDLDGVLVDACDLHKQALEQSMLEVVGFTISDDDHKTKFNGLPTLKKLELLKISSNETTKIFDLKQSKTLDLIQKNIALDQSKIDLFKFIKHEAGLAVVTNSIRQTAELMLKSCGVLDQVDILISNQDIRNAKPYPDGYIKAMVYCGAYPEKTLIIEDSPHGIMAAKLSGADVKVVKNSSEVTLNNLREIFLNGISV